MAKKIQTTIKLQLPAGKATPAPPVGHGAWSTWLEHHGFFVKQFNCPRLRKSPTE